MNLEQHLRDCLVAPDPGAAFTARVMARVSRGRARRYNRFFLCGAVLVAGVAAAMLAWRTSDMRPTPIDVAVIPTIAVPAPVAEEPVAQAVPVAEESLAAPLMPELPPAASPHYSVLVMPLRNDAQDVAGRGQVEAFYSSMLEELRKVPGIALQVPGGSADHVLTITTLASRATPSGSAPAQSDGRPGLVLNNRPSGYNVDYDIDPLTGKQRRGETTSFEAGGSGGPGSVVWIEMKVESRGEPASRYTFPIGIEGSAGQGRCAAPDARVKAECLTPAQLAARQLEKLRMQVFPPDVALQRRIVARLGNAGLTQDEQFQVLQDLLILQGDPVPPGQPAVLGRGSRLDDATLRALTGYAPTMPAFIRTQIWIMLRHEPRPELIAPLVDSLRRDADKQVRLAAMDTLAENFAAEPAFRAALESVAQKDPDDVVRAAARLQLYGLAQWRNDVLAALNDAGLPYESRLAPVLAGLRESRSWQDRQALQQDQQIVRKLVELGRAHLRDSAHTQSTIAVLGFFDGVNDPAARDLLDEAMQIPQLAPIVPRTFTATGGGSGAISRTGELRLQNGDSGFVPPALLERMQEVIQSGKPAGQ